MNLMRMKILCLVTAWLNKHYPQPMHNKLETTLTSLQEMKDKYEIQK